MTPHAATVPGDVGRLGLPSSQAAVRSDLRREISPILAEVDRPLEITYRTDVAIFRRL